MNMNTCCLHSNLSVFFEPFPSRVVLGYPGNAVLRGRRVSKVKEVNKVCKDRGETLVRQGPLDKQDPRVPPDPRDKGYVQSYLHNYSTLVHSVQLRRNVKKWERLNKACMPLVGH